ncbi:6-bladed beta-propeller [Bacteroides caecimuris]|jgi:hypothetical protein|uniref:Uncharacterized protein n=1 Tax=Bacteroides caecimuris TaxID=1796613 RepID=A0A1C7H1S2_9BACE|nr:6-bladed beta-propeller [Bacteroides caecimuris]ANU57752.1 hypothetical protein A4V03_09375 [Bacteroides caecimuris]NDO59835.1 6-bladed beta-propeller [Bacteroides caecimuris]OXE62201.1 hypothetical protein ADH74_16110 [Bacteroides caecimuris]QQR17383.1 6-bladed beta-propeller [Bacteroides caecimuris]UQA30363.1 6-bladed beta-propeller [Bacteroides caecimuris]
MKTSVLALSFLLCFSCTKKLDEETCLPLKESIEVDSKVENIDIFEDVSVIPLETTDESLLSDCQIVAFCDDKIIVRDINTLYFFNIETGRYESRICRQGNGPEEYVSLNDVCIDCADKLVYVLERRGNIKTYNYNGSFLKEYTNDSVVSIEMLESSRFVAYSGVNRQCDITLYNKDWNVVKKIWKRNKEVMNYRDIVEVRDFDVFNGYPCFMDTDTLCQINNENVNPLFYIDKGELALPFEIFTDIKRKKERDSYIWGDYGFLSEDFYFLRFYYDNKIYYDVWDVSSMKLMYRNIVSSPVDARGISILIDGKKINIWPSYVRGDMICSVLQGEEVEKLGLPTDNDENPVIVTCRIRKR